MQSSPRPARENSFTFLRMALALAVVSGHSYVLGGFDGDPISLRTGQGMAVHEMALQCFFMLSGYLLTRSLTSQPLLGRFAVRRCFRILPGYWVSLLVTGLIFAPAMFSYSYPDGFRISPSVVMEKVDALGYMGWNAIFWSSHVAIPPLFYSNPIKGSINGSLWSIFYEVLCYIVLGLAAAFGVLRRRNLVFGIFAVLFLPTLIHAVFPISLPPPIAVWHRILIVAFHPAGPNVALPFAAGVVAHFLVGSQRVWNARIFSIVLVGFAASMPLGAGRVFCPLALPYLLLSLAERLPFRNWERFGDYSYGTYIYAFVIQQCLVVMGIPQHGIGIYLASSLVLSTAAGALSWYLIERPAIWVGDRLLAKSGSQNSSNPRAFANDATPATPVHAG